MLHILQKFSMQFQGPSGVHLPVRLADEAGKVMRSSTRNARFTGAENRDEVFKIATEFFEGIDVLSMKVGPLSGALTTEFKDRNDKPCSLRRFMADNRFKPSATVIYLMIKTDKAPKKRSLSSSSSNVDDDDDEQLLRNVKMITSDELKFTDTVLGRGAMSTVYSGTWLDTPVALKQCVTVDEESAEDLAHAIKQEVALHFTLRHPNVIALYGICRESATVTLVTEKMDCSLGHIMDKEEHMTRKQQVFIAKEAAKGLAYLHSVKVVHGDVKPVNILVSDDRKTVKLCDMGLSRVKTNIRVTATVSARGTVPYMSPQIVLEGCRTGFSCDIWAFGGSLAEFFADDDLWPLPKKKHLLANHMKKAMKKKHMPQALRVLREKDEQLFNIVSPCLSYDVEHRPSARDLAQHFQQLHEVV